MKRKPPINGARSVMAGRKEPPDSLDFFCTPPFATRALCEVVLPHMHVPRFSTGHLWEPAAGEGHMAEVLRDYFVTVHASDVFDYGREYQVGSFVGDGPDIIIPTHDVDWVVTNPPFNESLRFVLRALAVARVGVAMFIRTQWAVEGVARYEFLFRNRPPTLFAPFVERVPLCKGKWDPDGSTATAYCWLVWIKGREPMPPFWIPPGQRKALTRPNDRERFAAWSLPKQMEAAE